MNSRKPTIKDKYLMMDAILINGEDSVTVQVPSQRAYPPFIAYDWKLYQCRNVASGSGEYDLVGRVHVIDAEAKAKECDSPD